MGEKPKLLDQVRDRMRRLHYAYKTERSYVHWIRRFILFHGQRHPGIWGDQGDRSVPKNEGR